MTQQEINYNREHVQEALDLNRARRLYLEALAQERERVEADTDRMIDAVNRNAEEARRRDRNAYDAMWETIQRQETEIPLIQVEMGPRYHRQEKITLGAMMVFLLMLSAIVGLFLWHFAIRG